MTTSIKQDHESPIWRLRLNDNALQLDVPLPNGAFSLHSRFKEDRCKIIPCHIHKGDDSIGATIRSQRVQEPILLHSYYKRRHVDNVLFLLGGAYTPRRIRPTIFCVSGSISIIQNLFQIFEHDNIARSSFVQRWTWSLAEIQDSTKVLTLVGATIVNKIEIN